MLERSILFVAAAALLAQASPPPQDRPALEYHHLHVGVDDPAAAMRRAAETVAGASRTILQGHGPGVRFDGRYLVFDRREGAPDELAPGARATAGGAYAEAVQWATARRLAVAPAAGDALRQFAAAQAEWPVTAVAFAAADLNAARAALAAQGIEPDAETAERVRYRSTSGLAIEIIEPTDRPDTHWCPMHPEVRAPGPATCRLCGMALVPIPPPQVGEYGVEVRLAPRQGGGASALRLHVLPPRGDVRVRRFVEVHDELLHLFVISRDLSRFAHVHPRLQPDGEFVLDGPIAPGEYVLIADFLPEGGTSQMVHRAVITPGYDGPLFAPPPRLVPTPREVVAAGVRVRLEHERATALRPVAMTFTMSDAATNAPIADLEPYLGAAAHLLIVSADLTVAVHGHPEGAPSSGPAIAFDPVLPLAGPYKLWLQFQRRGEVVTVPFVIEAAPW